MKLLFVYSFAPSGHASAAKALETRARALGHETRCLNISNDYHKILGPAINNVYLALIQSFPNLWSAMHDSEDAAEILSNWREVYHLFEGGRLRETVAELKPDRIVCTHAGPFAALTLSKEKGDVAAKLAGVLTDFQPHPYWAVPGADLYVTATSAGAETLIHRGIPRARVVDAGIPIHPIFDAPVDRDAARRELGLPADGPVLLVTGGSRGLGRVAEAVETLLPAFPQARLIVVCGANDGLYERLRARFTAEKRLMLRAVIEADEMKRLMSSADLMIGKAGGLTSAECLAVGLPLVVLDPIAGQEQANSDFLQKAGAAVQAGEPEGLAAVVAPLLEPRRLAQLRQAARDLGRPDAGRRILDAILA